MKKNAVTPPADQPSARRWPGFFSNSAIRALLWILVSLYFVGGLLFLLVREAVLPHIDNYRPQIAAALSRAAGRPVSIGALAVDWSGLRPGLSLKEVSIEDEQGLSALLLPRVDATLAWSSLWRGQAHFYRLEIIAPELTVRRQPDGRLFVAGLEIASGGSGAVDAGSLGGGIVDWLFGQHEIAVRDAKLIWSDRLRDAPDLRLEQVNLLLFSPGPNGASHYLGMQALPPAGVASGLDVRGELYGRAGDSASLRASLYAGLSGADLGAWRQWVDYPAALTGQGNVQLWGEVAAGELASLEARLALRDVSLRLSETLPGLAFKGVSGFFGARRAPSGIELTARELTLSGDEVNVGPFNAGLMLRQDGARYGDEGAVHIENLELAELARLAAHAPLDEVVRERLLALAPRGHLDRLDGAWKEGWKRPQGWQLQARFRGLGLNAYQRWPGADNLSGEISGDWQQGRYRLDSEQASLALPAVFPEPVIALSRLQADGQWQRRDGQIEIRLDSASFDNPDAAGSASGRYVTTPDGLGEIDLSARLTRVDALAVWRYMPWKVNETVRNWLRHGLKGGHSDDARLQLRGALRDFPFDEGREGQFLVTVRVNDGVLHYADGWPDIDRIDGDLRFERDTMHIDARYGHMFGVDMNNVVVAIAELGARDGEILTVHGQAAGPTSGFLRFIDESPVLERIGGFTGGLRATGTGDLDLALEIPLRHATQAAIKGAFHFSDNRVTVFEELPPVEKTAGRVDFTEHALTIPEITGRFLDHPLRVTASTKNDIVTFSASGTADMNVLQKAYPWPALARLNGKTAWQTDVRVGSKSGVAVTLRSDLQGIDSALPEPLNKSADEKWPSNVQLQFSRGDERRQMRLEVAQRAGLQLDLRKEDGKWTVENGGAGIGAPVKPVKQGVLLTARFDELDVDEWRGIFTPAETEGDNLHANDADVVSMLTELDIKAQRASVFGQEATGVELAALADKGGWKGRIVSEQAQGAFDWRSAGKGVFSAHFKHLAFGGDNRDKSPHTEAVPAAADENETADPAHLPALNIRADKFYLYGMDLGSLMLQASNQRGLWVLDAFELRNEHAALNGSGQWRTYGKPLTRLNLNLETNDIGKLLNRIGYPRVVKGGEATLNGNIEWQGVPTGMHLSSLSGELTLEAKKGQFRKLEPGVGRLLGILSLQALPRRLSLDFQDVFSEGFVFDSISGDISLISGVLYSKDLYIAGPPARIWISGTANAVNETQSLRVFVQPTLSESVAIGAAAGLINPIAGVVTYIAQKALSDPVEKMFAFGYTVTGSWADPQVEKLSGEEAQLNNRFRKR